MRLIFAGSAPVAAGAQPPPAPGEHRYAAATAAPTTTVSAAAASSSHHVLASVRSLVHSACSASPKPPQTYRAPQVG